MTMKPQISLSSIECKMIARYLATILEYKDILEEELFERIKKKIMIPLFKTENYIFIDQDLFKVLERILDEDGELVFFYDFVENPTIINKLLRKVQLYRKHLL